LSGLALIVRTLAVHTIKGLESRPSSQPSRLEPRRALGLALVKRWGPERGNSQLGWLWSCAVWITL